MINVSVVLSNGKEKNVRPFFVVLIWKINVFPDHLLFGDCCSKNIQKKNGGPGVPRARDRCAPL